MNQNILITFIIYSLICKAWSSPLQPIKQYLVSGLPTQSSALSNIQTMSLSHSSPKPSANMATLSALASLLSSGVPTSQHVSTVPAISLLSEPNLGTVPKSSASLDSLSALTRLLSSSVATSQHVSNVPTVPMSLLASLTEVKQKKEESNTIDTELLNNLAIALQLMIVNNILSSPLPETSSSTEPVVLPAYPLYDNPDPLTPISVAYSPVKNSNDHHSASAHQKPSQSQAYYVQNSYEPQPISFSAPSMPNAKFVGSSGFGDSNPFMSSVPSASLGSSRTGFTLMSPYEALSPNSPFSDPVLSSPYGSVITSKKDFQSPYAAIMAADNNKDLFSFPMNELF